MKSSFMKLFVAMAFATTVATIIIVKFGNTTLNYRENSIVYLHSNLPTTTSPTVQPIVTVSLEESISEDMKRCSLAMGMAPNVLDQNKYNIASIAKKAAFFLETFWKIVPKEYLSDYKNPCWYSNVTISPNVSKFLRAKLPAYHNDTISQSDVPWLHKELFETQTQGKQTLQCLPYFLVPGIPKSGTSTLHSALSQHPQIMDPENKEPQWWYKLPLSPPATKKYIDVFIARYLSAYLSPSSKISSKKDGSSLVTYDASQTMMVKLHDSSFDINHEDYCAFPAVISRVLPQAKIIVLMRDPVPRAYSHYIFMSHVRPESKPMKGDPALFFEKHIQKAVNKFHQCVRNSSIYECVNTVRTDFKEIKMWLGSGVYHIHIQKWMQFWPKDNFLLLTTEEMALKPVSTLRKITDFLSLDPFPEAAVNATNEKKNVNKSKYKKMLPETEKLLQSFYQPFNNKLEELFGINWKYDL